MPDSPTTPRADREYFDQALEQIRTKLLDTTRRSRLLNFRESARDVAVVDEMPNQIHEHLVLDGNNFDFDPIDDEDEEEESEDQTNSYADPRRPSSTDSNISRELPESLRGHTDVSPRYRDDRLQTPHSTKELERRLRKLYQEHRTIIEETGANNLYLAMGFLHWNDGEIENNSPLMLIPVRLERMGRAGDAKYNLAFDDEALDTNYSLSEKLRQKFDLQLPDLRDDQTPEDYWAAIAAAIQSKRRDGWRIAREVVLGLFRFQKQVMWHDLDPGRWPEHAPLIDKDMVRRVLLGPGVSDSEPRILSTPYNQDSVDAPELALVREADSSQFAALADALLHQDGLVIEGPPGTGKSQTITNLIAAAISEGKTVLFVAEKMAALDVVFRRLEEDGLGDFCLQLHGLKTGKKELLDSIEKRMMRRPPAPKELRRQREDLELARQELVDTSKALSETCGPEEFRVHETVWRVEQLRSRLPHDYRPAGTPDTSALSYTDYARIKRCLDDMGREWAGIPPAARDAWAGFRPLHLSESRRDDVAQTLRVCMTGLDEANRELLQSPAGSILIRSPLSRIFQIAGQHDELILPELPAAIPGLVILEVIRRGLLEQFGALIEQFSTYLAAVEVVAEVFDYAADDSADHARKLAENSSALSATACSPELRIGDLDREATDFARGIEWLDSAQDIASPVLEIVGGFARTIEDCERLALEAEKLADGPDDLLLHARPSHASERVKALYVEAREQSHKLSAQVSELTDFDASRLVDTHEVLSAVAVIQASRRYSLPGLRSSYRSAKRLLRDRMKDPKRFRRSPEFYEVLERLATAIRARDAFTTDSQLAEQFGQLFQGVETDWDRLGRLIEFSQELRKSRGPEVAAGLLADWSTHAELMQDVCQKLRNGATHIREFAERHPLPESLWRRPVVEIARNLTNWAARVDAARIDLDPSWCNSQTTLEQAIEAAKAYQLGQELERQIESNANLDFVVEHCWVRSETKVAPLQEAESWMQKRLEIAGMDRDLLQHQFDDSGEIDRSGFENLMANVRGVAGLLRDQIESLEQLGQIDRSAWLSSRGPGLANFQQKLADCTSQIEGLFSLARWENLRRQALEFGCGWVVEGVTSDLLQAEQCEDAFEYVVYSAALSQRIYSSPLLAQFGRESYERLRTRFASLDREILRLTAADISARLSRQSVPQGNGSGRVASYSEASLLRNEAKKKRRHIPVRQLVARAPNALQALKPCFLMSPLSVAQFLPPGEIEFDLVVMDEASQIRPEDALGSLARARRAIVVGDPKQLPPTSFFDTAMRDDDDAEETTLDDTESILEVCLKQFPFRRLRWHYRSEHEDLIRFSNERFYDNDLIVFPSPRGDSREYGVHSTFIEDPNYRKGRNRSEAQKVVDAIIDHVRTCPNKSLGVAAFNKRQADEIELILDQARRLNPELDRLIGEMNEREPLFIKNLENVQGDERDVIFVSTTYGPEKAGARTHQRFGPINSDLGWRRLNVVVTRARQRIEVFTSMRPTDVLVGDSASRGVRALRDYLEYAETGFLPTPVDNVGGSYENPFEQSVGSLIEALGYEVTPQVGVEGFFIDLGVRHPDRPGEYLMGIECDGAPYHSAPSVRDRDRLRQEILEGKGWFIHRVWSTSWFHARSSEVARLKAVIEQRLRDDRRLTPPPPNRSASRPHSVEPADDRASKTAAGLAGDTDSLRDALTRFWEKNIKPTHPNRDVSILSEQMIGHLVSELPETADQWRAAVPLALREHMDRSQMEFLEGVLEVIYEFG